MQHNLEEVLLAIFKEFGEKQIRKFFISNKIYYQSSGIEFEDLKQEMFMICWQAINKKVNAKQENSKKKMVDGKPLELKTREEFSKYIGGLLSQALFTSLRDITTSEKTNLGVLVFSNFKDGYYSETDPSNILNSIKKELDANQNLKDKAYKLLYLKFVKNKTEKQIAKELNFLDKDGLPDARITKNHYNALVKKYGKKENLYKPMITIDLDYITNEREVTMDNADLILSEIRTMVSVKAYDIVYEKIIENLTFREIASRRNMNYQTVKNIYDDAMILIQKKFCSEKE